MAEDEPVETKIQVDRKRLEAMITGDAPGDNADVFFSHVERITGASVGWPSRLKIRAKTKKDPFVKLTGTAECVQRAAQLIAERLQVKREKVTLKMEISHCLHSQIIGRGGRNTQQIMRDTGCHIHFPDSNKVQFMNAAGLAQAKNDQVSISGCAKDVERTREMLRAIGPLEVSVSIQLAPSRNLAAIQPRLDPGTLQRHFPLSPKNCSDGEVTVQFEKGGGVVEGGGGTGIGVGTLHFVMRSNSQNQLDMLRAFGRVCQLIGVFPSSIELFCYSQFEIRPTALPSLSAARWIAGKTNTQIQVNTQGLQISGPLEGIFVARKFITGLLPVSLHFDKPADVPRRTSNELRTLEGELDVQIVEKQRKMGKVKGTASWEEREKGCEYMLCSYEANLFNVYLARNKLLRLEEKKHQQQQQANMQSSSAFPTPSALVAHEEEEQQEFPQDSESAALMRNLCRESLRADQQPAIAAAAAAVFANLPAPLPFSASSTIGGTSAGVLPATASFLSVERELAEIKLDLEGGTGKAAGDGRRKLADEAPKSPDPEESPIAAGLLAGAKSVNLQKGEFRKVLDRERTTRFVDSTSPSASPLDRLPAEFWASYGLSSSLPADLFRAVGHHQKCGRSGNGIGIWPTLEEAQKAKRQTKEETKMVEMEGAEKQRVELGKGRPIVGRGLEDEEGREEEAHRRDRHGANGREEEEEENANKGGEADRNGNGQEQQQEKVPLAMPCRFVQSASAVASKPFPAGAGQRPIRGQQAAIALVHPRVAALQAGDGQQQQRTPKFTMSTGGLTFEGRNAGRQAAAMAYRAAIASADGSATRSAGGQPSSAPPTGSSAENCPPSPAAANFNWDIRTLTEPAQVLAQLGLGEHIPSFRAQEIDMQAFLLLDGQCLASLGLITLGARRKIMHAVNKLRESARQHGLYSL